MDQSARWQDVLRKLRVIDEHFVEDEAGLDFDPSLTCRLDVRTAALVQLGAMVATGSAAVGLEWSASRALATGATEDEIVDVLLVVGPVSGLGRVVAAVADVSRALDYDVEAALEATDE